MTNETNPSAASVARSFNAGDKLAGCYTLKQLLPFEGVAVVWLAHDEELDKDLTLHFLPDAVVADSRAMEEIRQATRRNRQMIHPRILRVHDLLEENNWAAISMDFIEAETVAGLKQKKENGTFNASEISRWVSELCQTLEDAHRVELLHRDIAPENLLVTKSGGLMVMNFGISRVILDSLVRNGQNVHGEGNLAYMSPQQLDGERPGRLDDVYSLGAVLYELLTGKPPFFKGEIISQIRKTVPPLVSERRAELSVGGDPVPKSWDKTIAACLAKSSEERPKSAAKVASELGSEKAAAVTPVSAPVSPAAKTVEPVQKEPVPEPAGAEAKEATAGEPVKPTPVKQPATHRERVPSKTPVIAEATVVSQSTVPKSGETAEPADVGAEASKSERRPGPTTPSGFPLRAFVEVEGGGEAAKKSKFPISILAAVVVVAAIFVAAYLAPSGDEAKPERKKETSFAPGTMSDPSQVRTAQNNITPQPPRDTRPVASSPAPVNVAATKATPTPTPTAPATPAAVVRTVSPSPAVVAARSPSPTPARTQPSAATPAPAATIAMTGVEAGSQLAQTIQMANEKVRAAEQARQALAALQKAQEEKAKAQQQAESDAQQAQAAMQQKIASTAAAKKAADDAAASLKQRTEAQQQAEAEAEQARKIADEKARVAAEARKALDDAALAIKQQTTTQQRTDAEIKDLQRMAEERQRAAADIARVATEASAQLQKQTQAAKQAETEAAQAQALVDKVRASEQARIADQENRKKQEEFDKQQAALEAQARAMAAQLEEIRKQTEALQKQRDEIRKRAEASARDGGASPAPEPPLPTGTPAAGAATSPAALMATAVATPTPKIPSVTARGTRGRLDQTMTNSLGMKFAAVGNVLFSVWITRVQDFEAFAKATNLKSAEWRRPGFQQGPDHPVVKVSWNDAMAFCKWLTDKERKEGVLAANQAYRLPTDLEWSTAVGLPDEPATTPEARDMDIQDQYPWGNQWPPPQGAGNFTGEETDSDVAIKGYDDGFKFTSPVGSFAANQAGLFDTGGNARQWCMDWWNNEQRDKVLRGSSWYNGALKLSLLSSCRNHAVPTSTQDTDGFRIVMATGEPATTGKGARR